VTAACRKAGINPVRQPIPVIPGAHYSCGGVVTDVNGQTGLPGLYAAGEVARTGMHGANRLASNSLLEGLVVGGRAGTAAAAHAELIGRPRATAPEPVGRPAMCRGDLQRAMNRDGSVVRAADGPHRVHDALWRGAPCGRTGRRGGDGDPPRGPGRRARPQREPGLSPPRRIFRRHPRPGAQHRYSAGRRRQRADRCAGGGVLMTLSKCELAEARPPISRALDEDLRYGPDVTTLATVPDGAKTTASLIIREPGVIAGVDVALLVLDEVLGADGYRVLDRVEDGARLQPGASALTVEAQMLGLLTAERTLLNLVCHLSGIATATAAWVDAVHGTKAKIRDTRKTLPGLRALQKYAVRVGGGVNHRLGLGDAALIKDNHVAAAGS